MTRVVLAGGGTAGHTSPLIATAQRLADLEPGIDLLAVGTARGLETTVVPAAGLRLELIPPVPMPRRPTPELFAVPGRLAASIRAARRILAGHRAQVVVGFGGYVSGPVYLAARTMGVPVVIHEQNAIPGLANKMAAPFAAVVAVSFPDTKLPKARYVGLPVRAEIARLDRRGRRTEARARLGLAPDRPTLLVSGGSQGAQSINAATLAARDALLSAGVQVLHVLGPKNFDPDDQPVTHAGSGAGYVPVAYVDAMEDAYAAADLMVGRSGAGTVMETATVGLPVVFVPLPHGNGEQARNAGFLVAGGAGLLVPNEEFTGERLLAEVLPLFADPAKLAAMSAATANLVPADAGGTLARLVLEAAKAR